MKWNEDFNFIEFYKILQNKHNIETEGVLIIIYKESLEMSRNMLIQMCFVSFLLVLTKNCWKSFNMTNMLSFKRLE